jgi:hypothetical protein
MQAELEKVSTLLDAATRSFSGNANNEDGCTQLSQAAAILEQVLATSEASETEPPLSWSAAA